MHIRILLILRAITLIALSPFIPTAFAQSSVPSATASTNDYQGLSKEWFGQWKGEITSRSRSGTTQKFDMELKVAPTDKPDRLEWTIVYNGPQGKSERFYTLVTKDQAKGEYVVDENNGIQIATTLFDDTLLNHFNVGGQRIWSSHRLLANTSTREIHFELSSADESQSSKSVGTENGLEVLSLPVNARQTGILKPIAIPVVKRETAELPFWKKLETEAYRGKQDDIYFIDANRGWYVNGAGKIFKTVDGGQSWLQQLHKPGTYFRCIAFVDERHGFAGNIGPDYFPNVTDKTPLYETVDGGVTWTEVTSIEGPPVVGLCALQVLKEPFINAGKLESRTRIMGVGRVGGPAAMIVSNDLGKSWQQIAIQDNASMAFDLHFFNRNEGFVAAASNSDVSQSNALILSTIDGGKTWKKSWQSNRPYELTWKISFPSRDVGYVTIQSYNPDPSVQDRFVAKTIDGGKSWSEMPLAKDAKVREFGIAFANERIGWVGATPHGFQTTDGGESWTVCEMGNAVNKIRLIEIEKDFIGYAIGVQLFRLDLPKSNLVPVSRKLPGD